MIEEISNSEKYIDYLILIIGWMLGIFSTFIIFILNRLFRKREIKKGILIELKSIQLRIAGICFLTTIENGIVTEEWVKWIKPYYELLSDSDDFDYLYDDPKKKFIVSDKSDSEFYEILKTWNNDSKINPKKSTPNYSEITFPFLESNYNSISLFSTKLQNKIALLKREITQLNREFKDADFYHAKTFENLTDINRKIILNNISDILKRISNKSKHIIKLIEIIIE